MSLLDIGKACNVCSTVDFLPFTCPYCSLTLCRAHVHSHQCQAGPGTAATTTTEQNPTAGPSSFRRQAFCEVMRCERPSIEAIGGREGDLLGEGVAKQVRCGGCGGAYCTSLVHITRIRYRSCCTDSRNHVGIGLRLLILARLHWT